MVIVFLQISDRIMVDNPTFQNGTAGQMCWGVACKQAGSIATQTPLGTLTCQRWPQFGLVGTDWVYAVPDNSVITLFPGGRLFHHQINTFPPLLFQSQSATLRGMFEFGSLYHYNYNINKVGP